MHKVLIAHSSDDLRSTLEIIISCKYETLTCANGTEAIEIIQKFRPDALILDLGLPEMNGISVLEVSKSFLPPVILATTWSQDHPTLKLLPSYGVDNVTVLPCRIGSLIYLLEDLIRENLDETPRTLKAYLRLLQIPVHLDGYRQLLSVIPMYMEDPSRTLTKEIYPVIAQEMQLNSWKSVDRSIRTAIESGWKAGDPALWQQYFPGTQKQPKVLQFVSELARRISEHNN